MATYRNHSRLLDGRCVLRHGRSDDRRRHTLQSGGWIIVAVLSEEKSVVDRQSCGRTILGVIIPNEGGGTEVLTGPRPPKFVPGTPLIPIMGPLAPLTEGGTGDREAVGAIASGCHVLF